MEALENMYKRQFFGRRNRLNWRAEPLCTAVQIVLAPESVIDVGCAIGDLVKQFLLMGVSCVGLEGSTACKDFLEVPENLIFFKDLREPVDVGRYDLAMCWEVAEHIEPEYADQLIDNLAGMSDRVLMSMAPPGQGGHHHVNCQPPEYWYKKWNERRYLLDEEPVAELKSELSPWKDKPGIKAFYYNMAFFRKVD